MSELSLHSTPDTRRCRLPGRCTRFGHFETRPPFERCVFVIVQLSGLRIGLAVGSSATESEQNQRQDKQNEELWLATGSGQQDLSYIAYFNHQDADSMWRFSVDAHSWERVQMPPTKVSWPSRRTLAAAVAISGGHGGLLFGGLGQPECRYGEQVSSWKCPDLNECTVGLSTLWSWKS